MKLRFILGDQLNFNISSLSNITKDDLIFMCEVNEQVQYANHHKKKLILIFSAMRHFAGELKDKGFNVIYTKLDDPQNTGSYYSELSRIVKKKNIKEIVVTYPSEYRILKELKKWSSNLKIKIDFLDNNNFLISKKEFSKWAEGKKQLRMEFFYREARRKFNILIKDNKPIGGAWNFDAENRKAFKNNINIPEPKTFKVDNITIDVINLVNKKFKNNFGHSTDFNFAVTRDQAKMVLETFINKRLLYFGDYQDAMVENEPWMFHSHISFYLNCGLLMPMECILAALDAFSKKKIPINSVEGFIRQILGWREFINGIYWLKMPDYEEKNFLKAERELPGFFWDGNTKMNCLKQSITETMQNAYAHHIQRLMILGNFLLLTGVSPKGVNNWYLSVYADAYQWVELPNVNGMILYADGGLLSSKPYAASGSYVNKMSNYCKNCFYNVKNKDDESACPFNYLYWDFLLKNQSKLLNNNRMSMIYRTAKKMSESKLKKISKLAKTFYEKLDSNKVV